MAYADYEFYRNVYGGTAIGEEDFLFLSNKASAYIDAATMRRAKTVGKNGAVLEGSGLFGFDISESGDLILHYAGDEAPDMRINDAGELIYTYSDILDAVKTACCALAEVFLDEENVNAASYSEDALMQGLSGETVGSWSKTYKTRAASSTDTQLFEKRKRDALTMYLGWTGLLRGRGYYVKGHGLC